jgi:hypothetical protein
MVEDTERLVRCAVRSPRSAAIAGVLFSLLLNHRRIQDEEGNNDPAIPV